MIILLCSCASLPYFYYILVVIPSNNCIHAHTHARTHSSIPTTMISLKPPWTCVQSKTKSSVTTTITWMNFCWTCYSSLTTVSSTTSVTQKLEKMEQLWRGISKSAVPIWDWEISACAVQLWILAQIIRTKVHEEFPLEIESEALRYQYLPLFTWNFIVKK